jgi:Ser/Thr protein kinase RdoA (MazF antagonist)
LGQVYERIEGPNMAEGVLGSTELDVGRVAQLGRVFATVHATVHACVPSGNLLELPQQRQFIPTVIRRIGSLAPELQEALVKALDELPDGQRLCHGDFHPYNVLMSPRGPIVIDWNNAHIGNPLEDVARSTLMLSGVSMVEPSLRSPIDHFTKAYLECYFELRPDNREQLVAWQPIVAAVRLSDNIPELQEWLLERVRTGLALPE